MIYNFILISFLLCFNAALFADEKTVLSADEADKIINEAIVQEKTVEKQQSYGYKNTKLKKSQKTLNKKMKKERTENGEAQSGM